MSAVYTKGFTDTSPKQEKDSTKKELVKRWFTDENEITLSRKGSHLEYEVLYYRTEEKIITDITDLTRDTSGSIIKSFKKRLFPIIDEEGQCNFLIFEPLQKKKFPEKDLTITLFSRSNSDNTPIWEIFNRTLNTSYLLPFDKTYIFNNSFYARYNELKFGGYSSTHEIGPKQEYVALSTFKGDEKQKTRYFKDFVIVKLKTDEKNEKRITAIFVKKVIAQSKVEVEGPHGKVFIDSDFWLVSLMAAGTSTRISNKVSREKHPFINRTLEFIDNHPIEKHASIIVEGIKKGTYFMKKIHIGRIEDTDVANVIIERLTDFKPSNYMKSWLVKSSLTQSMINLAKWQKKLNEKGDHQVHFSMLGSGASKESVIRPFIIKKTLESLKAVRKAIISFYKNKKEIMGQKKRLIVFILRYKSECIQTISFPETKSFKAFDKKEPSHEDPEDKTVQVFEIEHDYKRYFPQHTELFFEYVKGQWLRKIVPDNCITWDIQMLKEIGIYIDKKSFTSPRRTLSNSAPAISYSLDMTSKNASFIFALQQLEFPLKRVPFVLLARLNDAMIDKDFDEIGFIIATVGKMGLSQEAFLLLEMAKRSFGNNLHLIEIQTNLAKIIPNVEQKTILLKETLDNLTQQLESHDIKGDNGNIIRLLFETGSEQKKALEQLKQFSKKPGDPSSIMENIKQSLGTILKIIQLQNEEHSALFQNIRKQLSELLKIASNNKKDTTELKKSFRAFTNLLEKYLEGYGNTDLLESFISLRRYKTEQFNEAPSGSEELKSFISDLEKLKTLIEITHNNFIEFLKDSEIELSLTQAVILCISNDSEAKKSLETILEKSKEFYGDKDPLKLVENLKKSADAFADLGLIKEAVQTYKEASEILINKYEGKDIELLLQKLVELYHSTDVIEIKSQIQKEVQAIINVSFQKSLVIFNTTKAQKIIHYSIDLAKMASFLDLNNQALEIYQKVLNMLQNVEYEDNDLIEAEICQGLARLLYLSKRKQSAKIMLERSFETYKLSLGYDNPRIIEALEQLVGILIDLDQKKEAKTRFKELLSMCKKVYGEDHPRIQIIQDKFQQLDACIIL